jgi:signal transduction histidine kinase
LINQILMLARAEAGELTVDAASINLSTLASHVAEQVDALAEAKGITLATNIAPNVLVNGDAGWIERLLLILIDNAIKFTPSGGRVTITVSDVENRPLKTRFNILAVADTGVGIAPEALPRVFEPFYRGDAAQSRRSEGAGIGLALAKWIAEAHHGELNVTSAPNAGSTFTLRFAAAD